MLGHPKIGVEYNVYGEIDVAGVSPDPNQFVPIGYDDMGNLIVDAFGDGYDQDGTRLLWSESGFCEMIENETVVEANQKP